MTDPNEELSLVSKARPGRIEIKTVLWGVCALIFAGGLYVLVAGSPTKNRAAMDSTNTQPAVQYFKSTPPSAARNLR